jgi:hypothetical protein
MRIQKMALKNLKIDAINKKLLFKIIILDNNTDENRLCINCN